MTIDEALATLIATGRYVEATTPSGERVVVHVEMEDLLQDEARLDEREHRIRAVQDRQHELAP